jgi:hypothetical protein
MVQLPEPMRLARIKHQLRWNMIVVQPAIKLLGANFNPFTLTNFGIENLNGMSSGPWLTYITNQAATKSNRISFATGLAKSYP